MRGIDIALFFDEKEKYVVGLDIDGWFVGELSIDIIRKKHRLPKSKALELVKRWGLK